MDMEEDPKDIVLCGCVHCKFQTRRRRRIAKDHVRRYGAEDIGRYTTWFESEVQGLNIGEPQLEMTPDPRATSVHHREARRQALGGVASTLTNPFIAPEMGTYDIEEEDQGFETGIEDMLNDFFCDVLPREDVGVQEEAKKRQQARESKIKEQCNKIL